MMQFLTTFKKGIKSDVGTFQIAGCNKLCNVILCGEIFQIKNEIDDQDTLCWERSNKGNDSRHDGKKLWYIVFVQGNSLKDLIKISLTSIAIKGMFYLFLLCALNSWISSIISYAWFFPSRFWKIRYLCVFGRELLERIWNKKARMRTWGIRCHKIPLVSTPLFPQQS